MNVTEAIVKSLPECTTRKCKQKTEFFLSYVTFIIEAAFREAGIVPPGLLS